MKKQIKFLIVAMFAMFMATIEVKAGSDSEAYTQLQNCVSGTENSTCTLTGNITDNKLITINRDVTIDLAGHSITRETTNGNVIFNVTAGKLTLTGNGTVEIKNSTLGEDSAVVAILLTGTSSLVVENGTYIGRNAGIQVQGDNNSVEIKGGTIKAATSGIAVLANSSITIENGTIEGKYGIHAIGKSTDEKISVEVKNGTIKGTEQAIAIGGKDSTLEILNGNLTGQYGIAVFGENTIVNIKGGNINTSSFAISGNGSGSGISATINSTINISGGTLTSTKTAAIYHPQNGTLSITGGTITGELGVVARAGKVNISGDAVIEAKGDPNKEYRVGDAAQKGQKCTEDGTGCVKFNGGIGVVVDNTESSYPNEAQVTIKGGSFTTANDDAVLAFGDESNTVTEENGKEITVSGGKFNKKVETLYSGSTGEVKAGETYYVGEDAKEAIQDASYGTLVEVVSGNLNVSDVPSGVIVTNNGGSVTVNGIPVAQGGTIATPSTGNGSTTGNVEQPGTEEETKGTVIVEGVTYKDPGDGLVVEGSIVSEKDETYTEMIKMATDRGYTELFNMYEFHVKDNGELGKALTITFDLGTTNNGKTAYVLHKKHDNTYEQWERKVEDGKVTITVDELSPFVVALKANEVIEVPKTSSTNIAMPSIMAIMSLSGIAIVLSKKKLVK